MVLSVIYIYPKINTLLIKLSLARLKEVEALMKKLKKAKDEDIKVEDFPADNVDDEDDYDGVYLVELKSDVYKGELSEMARIKKLI